MHTSMDKYIHAFIHTDSYDSVRYICIYLCTYTYRYVLLMAATEQFTYYGV